MRVERRSSKGLRVVLKLGEALFFKALPQRLRQILESPEHHRRVCERLFPAAYSDPKREEEFRRLLGDDLIRRKLESVEVFEESLRNARVRRSRVEIEITPEQYEYWLGFVNDFRLMLGVELGIEDDDWGREFDPTEPMSEDLITLHLLSWLEEELLRAGDFDLPDLRPEDLEGPPEIL